MTEFSGHRDLAFSLVQTGPSPANSGTSLTLAAGGGDAMPSTLPFYATAASAGELPTLDNAEVVLVTNVAGDVVTMTRAQGGTDAQSIAAGWQFYAGVSSEWADEIEAAISLLNQGIFNPMDPEYGAVGDGTTNDRVALQACMSAANSWAATYGSATFYVPNRVFLLNTTTYGANILQPQSGVQIVGPGQFKLTAASSDGPVVVQIGAYTGVVVDGPRFDLGDNADGLCIRLDASLSTRVRNCTMANIGTSAVYIAGAAVDTVISNIKVAGGLYQILWHDASTATGTRIENCTFDGLGEACEGVEINTPTGLAEDTTVIGCTFKNMISGGAFVSALAIAHARGVNVLGNVFQDLTLCGVRGEDGCSTINIAQNEFNDIVGDNGIYFVLGSREQHTIKVDGNEFTRCAGAGASDHQVFFEPGGVFGPWRNVKISDNVFDGNGSTTVSLYCIRINGYLKDAQITGNDMQNQIGLVGFNNQSNAFYLASDSCAGTIDVSGNFATDCYNGMIFTGTVVANLIIKDNTVLGNTLAGISFQSGAVGTVVSGNVGYLTERQTFTASVADGGTVTHGLAATPTSAVVTPSVSGEMVSVTALGASTFTVAIKKHDGSAGTTQTLYWRASV